MSANAIAIRRAVAAARRLCPHANVDNVAAVCIAQEVPVGTVKAILFDLVAKVVAARQAHVPFRRASFAAVVGADRRRA